MDFNADAANGIAMEGYLYKRASNAFKTWSRYKFTRGTAHIKLHLSKINQMLGHSFSAVVCESDTDVHDVFMCFLGSRRWFSIQKNQLVYQKKFKVRF